MLSSTSTLFTTSPLFSTTTPSNKPPPRVLLHPVRASSSSSAACASDHRASSYVISSPPSSSSSLYDILGVPVSSTCHEIKTAYRRLARVCHPDVVANSSADEFMRINEAYLTLSDSARRAEYDRKMFRRVRPLSADYSGYFTGRKWETDQCW